MKKTGQKMLTVREVSERTGAAIPTVNLWCRKGKLANARREKSPYGEYWLIPESDLDGVVVRGRGRPRTVKPEASQGTEKKPSKRGKRA